MHISKFIKKYKLLNIRIKTHFLLSHPYLPSVPAYDCDKIAVTDAGGASEHRTVSFGPVQALARTTFFKLGQEWE